MLVLSVFTLGVAVAEPAELTVPGIESNPLYDDPKLFRMYYNALDLVLARQEIRDALDEFRLSASSVRRRMLIGAESVLRAASAEFAAYESVAARELGSDGAGDLSPGLLLADLGRAPRVFQTVLAAVGALLIGGGVANWTAWPWAVSMVSSGGAIFAVAALLWPLERLLGTTFFVQLLRGDGSEELVSAREHLIATVRDTEFIARVRTFINTARQGQFDHAYTVTESPGLSEVHDPINRVSTDIARELDELLSRFDGASIGVAGPRGSGKSTLIREYCEDVSFRTEDGGESNWRWSRGAKFPRREPADLRCVVAAPVDYVARDFVLHLFATFCRSVIATYGRIPSRRGLIMAVFWLRRAIDLVASLMWRALVFGGLAAVLLNWQGFIAKHLLAPTGWVQYTALAVICLGGLGFIWSSGHKAKSWIREVRGGESLLLASARGHLSRVRYLQTHTSGWSGALRLPGGAGGRHERGISRAEQPLSYPEVVDEFRNFAASVATNVHRSGRRVFIGVDELDKIGSGEQAERFLNEIKGVFGIPYLYFMVSVSDDALTAFERRGLPLRDAFDSSFDEIIHVGPLSYAESRRLLYRRVIGLTEPYVALCHCLAGGLARDVIRSARHLVRVAGGLSVTGATVVAGSARANIGSLNGYTQMRGEPGCSPLTLALVSSAVVEDELLRKLRAVKHVIARLAPENTIELQEVLHNISYLLAERKPIMNVVDIAATQVRGESPAAASVRLDFATYAYYCATLQEMFREQLDAQRMIEATAETGGPDTFDGLAAARNAFTLDTLLAWRLVTRFRMAWSMETREADKGQFQWAARKQE